MLLLWLPVSRKKGKTATIGSRNPVMDIACVTEFMNRYEKNHLFGIKRILDRWFFMSGKRSAVRSLWTNELLVKTTKNKKENLLQNTT